MTERSDRLRSLRELHAVDPGDAFVAYGLAMELSKRPEAEREAVGVFRRLLSASPEYLPAYLQFGMLLARRGESAEARAVLEAGIEVAGRARDAHAAEELRAALGTV